MVPPAPGARSRGTTQPGGKGWWRSHRCISGRRGDMVQGTKTRWFGGPPNTPHTCTHCHGRGAGPASSPWPAHGWGPWEGTRFWSFNTCRIKFVSVQSVVGKGPEMLRGKFLPTGSGSSPVAPLSAAPEAMGMGSCVLAGGIQGTWLPDSWAGGAAGSHCRAVWVLGWGRAGRGISMGSALGPHAKPGGFHTVQPQQARALPGARALRSGCLQGDLQAREDDENETKGDESFGSASPTPHSGSPKPSWVRPSPAWERVGAEPGDHKSPSSGAPCGSSGRGGGGRW